MSSGGRRWGGSATCLDRHEPAWRHAWPTCTAIVSKAWIVVGRVANMVRSWTLMAVVTRPGRSSRVRDETIGQLAQRATICATPTESVQTPRRCELSLPSALFVPSGKRRRVHPGDIGSRPRKRLAQSGACRARVQCLRQCKSPPVRNCCRHQTLASAAGDHMGRERSAHPLRPTAARIVTRRRADADDATLRRPPPDCGRPPATVRARDRRASGVPAPNCATSPR